MTAIPRPILGSVGSRIRLVFGDNGKEWLLLLNNDNGDTKWQSTDWKGMSNAVHNQLNNCEKKGRDIKTVDIGPDGEWYIKGVKPDGSGGYSWWGRTMASDEIEKKNETQVCFGSNYRGTESYVIIIGRNGYSTGGNANSHLVKRMKKMNAGGKGIDFVRLFHNGQYYISDDEGSQWEIPNNHCRKQLEAKSVEEVAIAGDGAWVVIHPNSFQSSTGVDDELDKNLRDFFSEQRRWGNERRQQIQEAYADRERRRLARVAEQEAREQAEREARERVEREPREARERAEQEVREARERADREAREAAEREEQEAGEAANSGTHVSFLVAKLEERLAEEARDIREAEANLLKRKQSFHEAMQSMPESTRSQISLGTSGDTAANNNTCVICQTEPAEMAVVPCGHVCLCIACSDACMSGQSGSRHCPLCRGNIRSMLKLYMGR